jgi:heme A synthase
VALIRSLILGLGVYALIAVGYPEWTGAAYHAMVLSAIAGGAVGIWALDKVLDFGTGAAKIGIEIAFLIAIALFVGYTMPQKSGKPPLQQLAEGVRPTRDSARRGLERLGVDPDGKAAGLVVKLFPKR